MTRPIKRDYTVYSTTCIFTVQGVTLDEAKQKAARTVPMRRGWTATWEHDGAGMHAYVVRNSKGAMQPGNCRFVYVTPTTGSVTVGPFAKTIGPRRTSHLDWSAD